MRSDGTPGGERDARWRPWWAIALAVAGLASLGVPLSISVLWIVLDRDLDLGLVDGILARFGWWGVTGSAVVALPWVLFLVRGGRLALGAGLTLTLLGWAWVARGG